MDLKTLKTFQTIVKYGSFVRAAQEMNYVQSTVTMQIQKLESELGVQLLERGKDIALTEAGRLFYDQSLQIVINVEQLQTALSDWKAGEAGHIRIGVTEPTASYRLPGLLKRFMSLYPNIRISVDISNTPVLSERNRLLITSEHCPYRRKLEMVMQETGNVTFDTMEIGSMTALKFYVENGLGIALIPKIMAEPSAAGTTIRPLGDSLIHMTIESCARNRHTRSSRRARGSIHISKIIS